MATQSSERSPLSPLSQLPYLETAEQRQQLSHHLADYHASTLRLGQGLTSTQYYQQAGISVRQE